MYVIVDQATGSQQSPRLLNQFSHLVRSNSKIEELLRFAKIHNFKRLSLYMSEVMESAKLTATLQPRLQYFISRAHASEIDVELAMEHPCAAPETIGPRDECAWFSDYQDSVDSEEKFDGFVTEYEFWNQTGGSKNVALTRYQAYLALLDTLRRLSSQHRRNSHSMTVRTYLGKLATEDEISASDKAVEILNRADEIYLHCYVNDPHDAFDYCKERIDLFNAAANKLGKVANISPIFSAEGDEPSTEPGGHFFGAWLQEQPNASTAFASADSLFASEYRAKRYAHVRLGGSQHFTYDLLRSHLRTNAAFE